MRFRVLKAICVGGKNRKPKSQLRPHCLGTNSNDNDNDDKIDITKNHYPHVIKVSMYLAPISLSGTL